MDRYNLFRLFLDAVADNYDITDAKMNNFSGQIEIAGTTEGSRVKVLVDYVEEEDGD